ncbi:MAG TPA: CHRD domain-containing protein [Gaiellaceae bacterium]|nr:CHRD domain-containing protein [Gaiellaceae bacterium]
MRYVGLTFLAALVVATSAVAAAQKSNSLHATLTGKAETPKGDPDGRGTAEIKVTGRRVCWEIKVSRVQTIMAAHIHKGRPGVAGPVVVPFGKVFKAKGCTTTTAAIAAAIQRTPSAYYVNVHNAKYPAGALRGQLRRDA